MAIKTCQLIGMMAAFGVAASTSAESSFQTEAALEPDGAAAAPQVPANGRAWTNFDSLAIRRFAPNAIFTSPDGSKFFFVTTTAKLDCDCNVFELTVFSSDAVLHALSRPGSSSPAPLLTLTRVSRDHGGPEFYNARWEPDSESIYFEGLDEQRRRQLFLLHATSGRVDALTEWPYGTHHATRYGDTIVGDATVPNSNLAEPIYPAHRIGRREAAATAFPSAEHLTRNGTFISFRGKHAWELASTSYVFPFAPIFTADSRKALVLRAPRDVPKAWSKYGVLSTRDPDDPDLTPLVQFIFVDAEGGKDRPVFDAPAGMATPVGSESASSVRAQALWARDGVHAVLVNTALPLTEEHPERREMAYVVGYNADSGQWNVIEPLVNTDREGRTRRVVEVGWRKQGSELLVRHEVDGRPDQGTIYVLQGDQWRGRAVSASVALPQVAKAAPRASRRGLTVTLRQSADQPPRVIASNGHREMTLTPPDPALNGVWWARTEPFEWQIAEGETAVGGLLLPRNQVGKQLPLVLQAYNYDPTHFAPDGPATHAYAAQSLVARGFAVLNMNITGLDDAKLGTLRELTDFSAHLDKAIHVLVTRGIIDRNRIGLIGFSRGGFESYYAITHPKRYRIAASIIDDAFPGSYTYNLTVRATNGRDFSVIYGGPFWQNKKTWLEHETSFNVDRVTAATLLTVHGQEEVPFSFEGIGAFSMNHIPFEFWVFPKGAHTLEMPRERLASQDLTLDWMSFWLLGQEDGDPEKEDQYVRWRKLRQLRDPVQVLSRQEAR